MLSGRLGRLWIAPSSMLVGAQEALCIMPSKKVANPPFQYQPSVPDPFRNHANLHSLFFPSISLCLVRLSALPLSWRFTVAETSCQTAIKKRIHYAAMSTIPL